MRDSWRDLAAVFTGLSQEVRLKMLYLLMTQGELCVCDFVGVLGITQSMASRHLRSLYHLGLLRDRRDAVWMHYRIAEDLTPGQQKILKMLGQLLTDIELEELTIKLKQWLKEKPCPDRPRDLPIRGKASCRIKGKR